MIGISVEGMMRKIFGVLILFLMAVYVMPEQRSPDCRYCLIAVTDHCPITMVKNEILLANIQLLDYDQQHIIIGIHSKSRLTRFIQEFPFAKMLIEDLKDKRLAGINNMKLIKRFHSLKFMEKRNAGSPLKLEANTDSTAKQNHSGTRAKRNLASTMIIKKIRMNIPQSIEGRHRKDNYSSNKGKPHV